MRKSKVSSFHLCEQPFHHVILSNLVVKVTRHQECMLCPTEIYNNNGRF